FLALIEGFLFFLQHHSSRSTRVPYPTLFRSWAGMGFHCVIFLSALQSVPPELHEAAQIDGAGWWRRFLTVTMRSLMPTITFLGIDRKSTRLNSSHASISYAVFCLKKKNGRVGLDLSLTGAGPTCVGHLDD